MPAAEHGAHQDADGPGRDLLRDRSKCLRVLPRIPSPFARAERVVCVAGLLRLSAEPQAGFRPSHCEAATWHSQNPGQAFRYFLWLRRRACRQVGVMPTCTIRCPLGGGPFRDGNGWTSQS